MYLSTYSLVCWLRYPQHGPNRNYIIIIFLMEVTKLWNILWLYCGRNLLSRSADATMEVWQTLRKRKRMTWEPSDWGTVWMLLYVKKCLPFASLTFNLVLAFLIIIILTRFYQTRCYFLYKRKVFCILRSKVKSTEFYFPSIQPSAKTVKSVSPL